MVASCYILNSKILFQRVLYVSPPSHARKFRSYARRYAHLNPFHSSNRLLIQQSPAVYC